MKFNIITNLNNGVGLQRDFEILRDHLEALGHGVHGVQFNVDQAAPEADVNVFLEVVAQRFFAAGREQWVVPNPEWWFQGWDSLIPRFARVLAKTRHAEDLFRRKGAKVEFLGWQSRDLLDVSVRRERRFLHVAGKSQTKNTVAVIECWRQQRPAAELTVVSEHFACGGMARVTHVRRATDEQLHFLMNSHLFHLVPSAYEGWGHSLHEGLGVGAVVITSDAAPMNELDTPQELRVRPAGISGQHHAVSLHAVEAAGIFRSVNRAMKLDDEVIGRYSRQAREAYERECAEFGKRLEALIA